MSDDDFLRRWSRRKHQARKGEVEEPAPPLPPDVVQPKVPAAQPPQDGGVSDEPPLPPLESLTPESDFTPFMRAKVDPAARNQALKTLFSDPRYNIMDGLDVYIDDYSKPDPLPEGWLEKMTQVARLGIWQPPPEGDGAEAGGAAAAAAPETGAVSPAPAPDDPAPSPPRDKGDL